MLSKLKNHSIDNLRMVLWFFGIMFAINVKKIEKYIPSFIKDVIRHKLFKIFVMFIALYMYTESYFRSGVVTFTIFISSYLIDILNLKELLTNYKN